jgi:hypothetical protein
MGTGILRDLLHVWDWRERRKKKTYSDFRRAEPPAVPGLPRPLIQSVEFRPVVQMCEPVPIVVRAVNAGAQAIEAGIMISFPDVTKNGERAIVVADANAGTVIQREAGDELLSADRGYREVFTARYLAREVHTSPWDAGALLILSLQVTPLQEGPLKFQVTAWSAADDWAAIQRNPTTREVVDQQNHGVHAFAMNVLKMR